MSYPTLINDHAEDSAAGRAGRRVFSPGAGDVRFAISSYEVVSTNHLRMNKSTDAGLTWTAVDTANEPTIDAQVDETELDAIIDPSDANVIILVWVAPRAASIQPLWTEYGEYKVNTFNMTTEVWGTASTGGPPAYYSFGRAAIDSQYTGILFNICKDAADGSVWLSYLTLVDVGTADPVGAGALMVRTSIIQLDSGGTWGTPILMMAEPAVLGNYLPCGICVGDSSRIHVTATQYTMTNIFPFGFQKTPDWERLYHQSYLSGALGSVQLVDSQLYTNSFFENTASPLVTRTVGATTEILCGYGWTPYATPPGSRNQEYVEEKVARAISAADPAWTIETIPGISNIGNSDELTMWCAPITDGARLIVYSNFSDVTGNVWLSEYIGGAWTTARYMFSPGINWNLYGDIALLNLVNGGNSVGAVLVTGAASQTYYYELLLQSPAASNYIF